jgi:hypothetical protein
VAGVTFIDARIAPNLRATGQSLFNGLSGSLGLVLETNLFGLLMDHLGPSGVFLLAGLIGSLSVLMLAITMPGTTPEPIRP